MLVRKSRIDRDTMDGIGETLRRLESLIAQSQEPEDDTSKRLAEIEGKIAVLEGMDNTAAVKAEVAALREELRREEDDDDDDEPDFSAITSALEDLRTMVSEATKPRVFRFDIERGSDKRIMGVTAREDDSVPDLAEIGPQIDRIERLMRESPGGYLSNDEAQKRYRRLLSERDKAVNG